MQGHRNFIGSLTEMLEFDHGSASHNSVVDEQRFWNNILHNTLDPQNLPDYVLAAHDAGPSYMNSANQLDSSSRIWNADESVSNDNSISEEHRDNAKAEQAWPSSIEVSVEGEPNIEERQLEFSGELSLENVNISLNLDISDDSELLVQHSNSMSATQNLVQHVLQGGTARQSAETGFYLHPRNPCLSDSTHLSSSSSGASNPHGNSSGFSSEDGDTRPGVSFDGRRLACKRKNIEGFSISRRARKVLPTESSSFHSETAANAPTATSRISGSSESSCGANHSDELLTHDFRSVARDVVTEGYPTSTANRDAESSHRNFRIRINPTQQLDFSPQNPRAPHISMRCLNHWSSDHLSNEGSFLVHQTRAPRSVCSSSSSQRTPPTMMVSPIPPNLHPSQLVSPTTSSPSLGSSSFSPSPGERISASRDESNRQIISRNDFHEIPYLLPLASVQNASQGPARGSLGGGSLASSGSASSSGSLSSSWPSWASNHDPAARRLSELVRRSFLPSINLNTSSLVDNIPFQQPPGPSVAPLEAGHRPQFGLRSSSQAYLRSGFLMDIQNEGGVLGVPLPTANSAAAREGRPQTITEIRNAFCLMRRGENLRLEDVLFLDPAMFYAGVDLHDRHRDLRLDVDNMSYEELLALEERIGNVSTGLDEESIMKGLKRRNYQVIILGASPEAEPCCICQEAYVEGEEVGALQCRHDFHSGCIKQWLMLKNLCPICKETGLLT